MVATGQTCPYALRTTLDSDPCDRRVGAFDDDAEC